MRRWLPIITPPWWIIAIPLIALVGWHASCLVVCLFAYWKYGLAFTGDVFGPRPQVVHAGCCIGYALAYGAFRATAFHPMFRSEYRNWLASTPWTSRLPMPLGPIHLVWQDALFLAPAVLLALGPQVRLIIGVPFAFVVIYCLFITVSLFATGVRLIGYCLVFLGGLVLHFAVPALEAGEPLWLPLTVCLLAYPLLWWGLRRSLARFSNWDSSWFDSSLSVTSNEEAMRRRTEKQLGWPFDAIRLQRKPRVWDARDEVLISLLLGWWVYASQMGMPWQALLSLMLVGSPAPVVSFIWTKYRAPISLWGRLRTGHWIIPGYDRCFLWPLAVFGLQCALVDVRNLLSLSLLAAVSIQTTLVSWCWLKAAAAFERFQLTGSHSIPVPFTVSSNSQRFTSA